MILCLDHRYQSTFHKSPQSFPQNLYCAGSFPFSKRPNGDLNKRMATDLVIFVSNHDFRLNMIQVESQFFQ